MYLLPATMATAGEGLSTARATRGRQLQGRARAQCVYHWVGSQNQCLEIRTRSLAESTCLLQDSIPTLDVSISPQPDRSLQGGLVDGALQVRQCAWFVQ